MIICMIVLVSGCATHSIPPTDRREVHAQADAVGRAMDAWCDDKITEKQRDYLLHKEYLWEHGEITARDYYRAEEKILR